MKLKFIALATLVLAFLLATSSISAQSDDQLHVFRVLGAKGNIILYQLNNYKVLAYDSVTGQSRTLPQDQDFASVSSDGNWIAYLEFNNLVLLSTTDWSLKVIYEADADTYVPQQDFQWLQNDRSDVLIFSVGYMSGEQSLGGIEVYDLKNNTRQDLLIGAAKYSLQVSKEGILFFSSLYWDGPTSQHLYSFLDKTDVILLDDISKSQQRYTWLDTNGSVYDASQFNPFNAVILDRSGGEMLLKLWVHTDLTEEIVTFNGHAISAPIATIPGDLGLQFDAYYMKTGILVFDSKTVTFYGPSGPKDVTNLLPLEATQLPTLQELATQAAA